MLVQRWSSHRRWTNGKPTLIQRLVSAGKVFPRKKHETMTQCWPTIYNAGSTLYRVLPLAVMPCKHTTFSMLAECWFTVADGAPTLSQHRINVQCCCAIATLCMSLSNPMSQVYLRRHHITLDWLWFRL